MRRGPRRKSDQRITITAITGPASYPPTVSEFIGHWTHANGLLGASPYALALPDDKSTLTLAQAA